MTLKIAVVGNGPATAARAGLVYEGIGRSLVRQRVDAWA